VTVVVPYAGSEPQISADYSGGKAFISDNMSINIREGKKIIKAGYQLGK
jgi:hypothetical protein